MKIKLTVKTKLQALGLEVYLKGMTLNWEKEVLLENDTRTKFTIDMPGANLDIANHLFSEWGKVEKA